VWQQNTFEIFDEVEDLLKVVVLIVVAYHHQYENNDLRDVFSFA